MDLGVIGLGMMGRAMARNLLRAGHRLTVYNRTRCRAEELQSEGALIAETPAEACRGAAVAPVWRMTARWNRLSSGKTASRGRSPRAAFTFR